MVGGAVGGTSPWVQPMVASKLDTGCRTTVAVPRCHRSAVRPSPCLLQLVCERRAKVWRLEKCRDSFQQAGACDSDWAVSGRVVRAGLSRCHSGPTCLLLALPRVLL